MATFGHAFKVSKNSNISQVVRCCMCKHNIYKERRLHTVSFQSAQLYAQHLPSSYTQNGKPDIRFTQIRYNSGGGKNFFQNVFENIKRDFEKNKEMKENLKKFREEREKLEQSDALKQARKKFENIEKETSGLKESLKGVREKVSETFEEVQKSDIGKKAGEITEELGKTAGKAAEKLSQSTQNISKTASYKTISQGVKAVKDEFDETTLSGATHYKPPAKLRMRSEFAMSSKEDRHVDADDESTGMVLHKDSKWYQSWQNFKDNNAYMNKVFDLKMKYDESDHLIVRGTRFFTDKMGQLFGGVFSKTELSDVLTEICKIEPDFDKERFLKMCEKEIIPNILEAIVRGDLTILKDWCYEAPFNALAAPIKEVKKAKYVMCSRVLDINNLDLAAGKMMEQGPVLVIMFQSQQIIVVKDQKGNVIEGDPDKIMRVTYVWALCRDQEELNPRAAWKLLDISAVTGSQFL
ncbi:mitochondrial import inner membrane translocase subunit TIM44-like [Mytilus californianus]|uniref:mitochondrial import inner membrane translocase subunit TIM44-like n=1 Tax=Mytilus californianus TaxID=6549 RepID=UPI002245733F|nr:mitochondrial import inner membrane translocase subunit TIM44-like [Mytilus californianus]